ncbi:MAG: C39 family peptidase [Oscillospiraceae bacterium]|nr:C39 family peptidase [Oscillospiraceae bacterium]
MIYYPVPRILQNPELPNGCEITSLCMLLRFWGYDADKCLLADRYLPRTETWWGTDPDLAYMGDPHREDDSPRCGYYCFAGPIVAAAEAYLVDQQTPARVRAVDLTGAGEEELIACLRSGCPFLFWASLHFDDICFDPCGSYPLPGGREHRIFHHLHCMVCCGVDEDFFYVSDPLAFNTRVPRTQFLKIYRQLGMRAVTLQPAP